MLECHINIKIVWKCVVLFFFLQLTTVDRDIGDNGRIKFTLVQGYKDKFAVDKDRGYITLQQLLNTEDVGKVILTVGASDHGKILIYSNRG
jgi:hypothetical protein